MFPYLEIVIPQRNIHVNFSNPFNARMWLSLLRAHPRHGLKFIPNLNVSAQKLGFSFKSNSLGFRGPIASRGPNVLLGTSFAMGLSVNVGKNWYDLLLQDEGWFNAGMPVGPSNHARVLADFYQGSAQTLLYVYHPNLWKTATGFEIADQSERDIFQVMGWNSDLFHAFKSYPRWIVKEIVRASTGHMVYGNWNDRPFLFNARYNYMDETRHAAFIARQQDILNELFGFFSRVIVIRAPIKEECVSGASCTPALMELRRNYDILWERFRTAVPSHVRCYQLDHDVFGDECFLPFDTHWSEAGNLLFATLVEPILRANNVDFIKSIEAQ